MILEFVARSACRAKLKLPVLAGYATVCKEWRDAIEEVNFKSLSVKQSCLPEFGALFRSYPRRRTWLKHLWLRIELPRYDRALEKIPESMEEQDENNIVFTDGISSLFDILSRWKTEQCSGFSLELSAHSPSDRRQLFGEGGLTAERESRFFEFDLDLDLIGIPEPSGSFGLPEVNVISKFCVLRRNYRNISSRALLHILLSLPRVTQLHYEPWHQLDREAQDSLDMGK